MLEVNNLHVYYGNIHALKDVSFTVNDGEIVTLIGANGAGKTTIMHSVSGLIKPRSGHILLKGQDISNTTAQQRVKLGMSQAPEGRRIFPHLTVLENLEMGAYLRNDAVGIREDIENIYRHFPVLKERTRQQAGTLSGGEQQMLAMGRALMSKPTILLLDEPSMGLSPLLVQEIFAIIREIHEAGTTILLVEQNANMALRVADRAYVLETGRIVLSGTGSELITSPEIKKAYLGG